MSGARLMWMGLGAAAVCTAVVHTSGALADRNEARRALDALDAARSDASELSALRARAAVKMYGPAPEEAIVGAVHRAAIDAGLAPGIARSITRQPGRMGREGDAMVQSVRIELDAMSVADLGRFLEAWRAGQPAWRVTGIAMKRAGSGGAAGYRVSLTCSAEYASEG